LVRQDDFCATNCRFRGFARLLQWCFGPAGSPAPLAQFVQNRRRWAKTTFLSRFPGRGQRFVQGATFLVGEVITFVVRNQVDNRPFG
jgi:hypothetical protein